MSANDLSVDNFSLGRDKRNALNELKEDLVQRAMKFLKDSKSKPHEMGDKQIRNLVALAQMAATPREIEAFIDYQMGRDDREKSWRNKINGQPFGEALKREIREVENMARQKYPEDNSFVLLCLAQFFGYLAWRVKYLDYLRNKTGKDGGEQVGSRR